MTKEQLLELLERFFDPVTSGKNAILLAFEDQDIESIRKNTHFMKGSSSFLGMQSIYDACQHISETLQSNASPDFIELANHFENAWVGSQEEVEAYVKEQMQGK
jgi:HPt (histidine-containing phosphotransfer) domain-containing protein